MAVMTKDELHIKLLEDLGDLFDGVCHDCDRDERTDTCEARDGHCRKVYDSVDENTPAQFAQLRRTWLRYHDEAGIWGKLKEEEGG